MEPLPYLRPMPPVPWSRFHTRAPCLRFPGPTAALAFFASDFPERPAPYTTGLALSGASCRCQASILSVSIQPPVRTSSASCPCQVSIPSVPVRHPVRVRSASRPYQFGIPSAPVRHPVRVRSSSPKTALHCPKCCRRTPPSPTRSHWPRPPGPAPHFPP